MSNEQPIKQLSINIMNSLVLAAKHKGMNQGNIADSSGVNKSLISHLKSGKRLLNLKTINLLSEVIGVEVEIKLKSKVRSR